jgi:restriction system protein
MAIPDYQSLMLPVLRIAAKGETSVPITENQVSIEFNLSNADRELLLPSGKQRILHNRIHWAKFYLSKAGLIESPRRGRFVATKQGRQLLEQHPERIDNQFLLSIPAFMDFYKSNQTTEKAETISSVVEDIATPEEIIEKSYNALQVALRSDLLDRILQNSPQFFESLIVNLLVAMGYGGSHKDAAQQLGKSGDGGIDGVINEDFLGLDRVYIQAKRYDLSNVIGRPVIQAFTGSLVGFGATKGVFVTTSTFSSQAREYVTRIPQRVVLIDGKLLTELMIEHSVGVRIQRAIEFKRLDEDFFSED